MDDFACPRGWMDQVESWKDGEKTPVLPGDFSAVTNNFSTMGGHQHLLSPGSLKKKHLIKVDVELCDDQGIHGFHISLQFTSRPAGVFLGESVFFRGHLVGPIKPLINRVVTSKTPLLGCPWKLVTGL